MGRVMLAMAAAIEESEAKTSITCVCRHGEKVKLRRVGITSLHATLSEAFVIQSGCPKCEGKNPPMHPRGLNEPPDTDPPTPQPTPLEPVLS